MLRFDDRQGEPALPFDEHAASRPPSQFGPYRVLHQIGSGALGPVFRAFDASGDRVVVVKALAVEAIPEEVARLSADLRGLVARPLTHDALVPVVDCGIERSTAFVVMPSAGGDSLDVALRTGGPWTAELCLSVLEPVAEAIDAAWAAGVGHGAIHSRDIFVELEVGGRPRVRTSGFGIRPALARAGIELPLRRPAASPEREAGGTLSVGDDIYALAVLAHEVLTGSRPGVGGEQDGAFRADVSPESRAALRLVLARALSTDVDALFGTASALAGALRQAVDAPASLGTLSTMAAVERPPVPARSGPVIVPAPTHIVDIPAAEVPRPARRTRSTARTTAAPAGAGADPPQATELPAPVPLALAPEPTMRAARLDRQPQAPLIRDPAAGPAEVASHAALAARRPYPWVGIAAAGLAGIALGLTGGYAWGLSRGRTPITTTAAVQLEAPAANGAAPAPGDTDVPLVAAPPSSSAAGAVPLETARGQQAAPGSTGERPAAAASSDPPGPPVPAVARTAVRPAAPRPAAARAALGSLSVDSRPRGARVVVDGKRLGVTPLVVSALSPGVHRVTIERSGYAPLVTRADVKAGERARVNVTLARQK